MMTDPSDALKSFQHHIHSSELLDAMQTGELDPDVWLLMDSINKKPRFTFVNLDGKTVTAMVVFVEGQKIGGHHVFDIGYAVPEPYRQQGRASNIVKTAVSELKHALPKIGIPKFYVQAVVGADNEASQRVAISTISKKPKATTDSASGLPALHYIKLFG